ncbi:MAG: zinc ribbon domain-containing protein [Aggregatilineales bacterium]
MHRLTYEYRIYPRKHQGGRLEQLLEQGREVYNAALRQCRNAFEATNTHQTAISQWPYFRDWRNTFSDLLLNASSLQHILRRVDKAYAALLAYKAANAGSQVVFVNPAYTSQACSGWGVMVEKR